MIETDTLTSAHIHALLADNGFETEDTAPGVFAIRQPDSGLTIHAVVEGQVIFFSLTCLTVPDGKLTPQVLRLMLQADNGISTSHFQLYAMGEGQTAVALSNFAKLQELGPDDEDDILSCLNFLLADLSVAKRLLEQLA
ncbi:MAG TPA: hypothetical protein VHZ55_15235 [Bryobacteraceae bacterium]|jgi:hypothetical protein|nr:hypothetical protein [Bryobacteraceae bacterium]